MTQENQDVTMYAGDNKQLLISLTSSDDTTVDITGARIEWVAKCGNHIIRKTTGAGIVISSGDSFVVMLDSVDTVGRYGTYYHEAEVTTTSGNVATVIAGRLILKQSIAGSTDPVWTSDK